MRGEIIFICPHCRTAVRSGESLTAHVACYLRATGQVTVAPPTQEIQS